MTCGCLFREARLIRLSLSIQMVHALLILISLLQKLRKNALRADQKNDRKRGNLEPRVLRQHRLLSLQGRLPMIPLTELRHQDLLLQFLVIVKQNLIL